MRPLRLLFILLIIIVIISSLTGCMQISLRPRLVKVAVPNTIDSFPLYVANHQGYFDDHQIKVEFIPVASAEERDALLVTGQVDAAVSDLISVLMMNQSSINVVIVRNCLSATQDFPYYRIITSAGSGIDHPDQLRQQPVAVSGSGTLEFVTEFILQQSGLTINEISTFPIPIVADRYSLILSGKVPVATLPEPWASLAIHNGARELLSDKTIPEMSGSVIVFRSEFIKEYPQSVKNFLSGYETAVQEINKNKFRWNDILSKYNILPTSIIGRYILPDYPSASVPDDHQFVDAVVWALDRDYIQVSEYYEAIIDPSFLP